MAKKTENSTPKVSDAVLNIGRELLKNHPEMKVIYMTSDGRGFYEQSDAANYASKLKDKTVTPVEKA